MSTILDSHCHPQFPQYDADRDEMIKRNLEQGVFMIAVGANLETSKQAIELANKYNRIWATVGLHPDEIQLLNCYDRNNLARYDISDFKILMKKKKVVAVGEVGLDYYRTPEGEKRERQKKVFLEFADLAKEKNLPLVLHVRNEKNGKSAHDDMIELLSSNMSGVTHSFTGTLDEAKKYLNLRFYLGLNGIITFTKEYDELIKFLPIDSILIETDAPWLTPAPNRGKRNEPFGVVEVAQKIAMLKNMSFEMVAQETFANTQKLFKIH